MKTYKMTEAQRAYSREAKRRSRANRKARGLEENNPYCPEREREKYLANKQLYIDKAKKWNQKNKHKLTAAVHNNRIINLYPEKITENSPSNKELSDWLLLNADTKCFFCGKQSTQIDHILPLSKGGLHEFANLRRLCKKCNQTKSNFTDEELVDWCKNVIAALC
ncbi:HNH endonuclease [Xanthomonas phage DES1]|nr:HNH endonuclease [Xanthomonas phage DES1]